MIPRTTVFLAFAVGIVGCSADTTTDSSQDEVNGARPAFAFACDGAISRLATVDLSLHPKCVDGPPGSRCGEPSEVTCDAQDVRFSYKAPAARCPGVDVFEWNGAECVAHSTRGEVDGGAGMLQCNGKDCEHLFATKEACTEHAKTCLSP